MGLFDFGGEDIYTVECQTIPMLDKTPPNFYVSEIVTSVLGNRDTSYTIFKIYTTGPTATLKRYIRYGKNEYYFGLPTVTTNFNFIDLDSIQLAIETYESPDAINLVDVYYGPITNDINAMIYLFKNYNFNIQTYQLTITDPYNPFGTIEYSFQGTDNGGSRAVFSRQIVDYDDFGDYYWTDFYYINGMPTKPTGNWHIALYSVVGTPGLKLFEYKVGTGTFPVLDGASSIINTDPNPIAVIRKDYRFIDDYPTQQYETTKKLLDIMNIPLDSIIEEFEGQGQISKITNLHLLIASNIRDTTPEVQRYLYEFWNTVNDNNLGGVNAEYNTKEYFEDTYYSTFWSSQRFGNEYRLEEQRYDHALYYKYIKKTTHNGVLGKVGTVTTTFNINQSDDALNETTDDPFEEGEPYPDPILQSSIIYKKQISATQYSKLEVFGLYVVEEIPQTNGDIQYKYIYLADSQNFLVPLIQDILREEMPIRDQEVVIFRALHFVVYAADKQHISWFDSFFGSFLGQLIITIASVYFFGLPAGATSWTSVGIDIFIKQVAISFAISLVVSKLLAPILGDSPFLFAIAAMAVGFYGGQLAGTVPGNLSFADFLLQDIWSIVKFAGNVLNAMTVESALAIEDLYREMEEFDRNIKEKQQELADAKDYLNTSLINPLNLRTLRADKYFKESGNYFKHCLQTNLAAKMKAAPGNYISTTKDVWSTMPTYI